MRWLRIEGCSTRDGNQLCLRHGNKIEHGAPKARHVAAEDIRIRDVRLIQEPQRKVFLIDRKKISEVTDKQKYWIYRNSIGDRLFFSDKI